MSGVENPRQVTESQSLHPLEENEKKRKLNEEINSNLSAPANPENTEVTLENVREKAKTAINGNRLPDNYESRSEEEKRKIMEDKQKHPELYKMFEEVSFFLAGFLPEASGLSPEDTENFPDIVTGKLLAKLPDSVKELITQWGKVFFDDNEQETDESLAQYDSLNADTYRKGIFERYASKSRIVKEALDICGSSQFRGPEVAYGRLACAQVATEILRRAGYLSKQILSVDGSIAELKKRGWKSHSPTEKPQAGWVVIWNRSVNRNRNGEIVAGHGHIGIVVSNEGQCVSNSSNKKTPRIHNINYTQRGVAMFLSPPEERA